MQNVQLSTNDLVTLLTCKMSSGEVYSTETWKLFLQTFAGSIDEALNQFSNEVLNLKSDDKNIVQFFDLCFKT